MIEDKVVLILGAGASAPYGFPIASELRDRILRFFRGEIGLLDKSEEMEALAGLGYSSEELKRFEEDFFVSQQPSIDAFLESREDWLSLGLRVIAAFLIPCERESMLYPERVMRGQWYQYLFRRMGPTREELEGSLERLAIVTFNYDRSLEYYLYRTVKHAYRLSDTEAAALLEMLRIVHVYGQLGKPSFLGKGGLEYGVSLEDLKSVEVAASGIKIVSRNEGLLEEFGRAQKWIREARTVCLLGFGYDGTNLERLDIPGNFRRRSGMGRLLGCGYGLEIDVVKRTEKRLSYGWEEGEAPQYGGGQYVSQGIVLGETDEDALMFLKKHLVLG